MKSLFCLAVAAAGMFSVVSCGHGGNSAESDSIARADSIRQADSIHAADSIAQIIADSVARADSITRADSIAKAAEANRDKSIDKDLRYVQSVINDLRSAGGGGTWMIHEAEAARQTMNKLRSKTARMSPEQLKRYNQLKKKF